MDNSDIICLRPDEIMQRQTAQVKHYIDRTTINEMPPCLFRRDTFATGNNQNSGAGFRRSLLLEGLSDDRQRNDRE
jgi:hypothetical protein